LKLIAPIFDVALVVGQKTAIYIIEGPTHLNSLFHRQPIEFLKCPFWDSRSRKRWQQGFEFSTHTSPDGSSHHHHLIGPEDLVAEEVDEYVEKDEPFSRSPRVEVTAAEMRTKSS